MKVLIVDDEKIILQKLIKQVGGFPGIKIIAGYNSSLDALQFIEQNPTLVDVAFLDISMPGMDGLTLAERLQAVSTKISIVFITAYDEHAIKAFELNAIDYILKPVQQERLAKTIQRLQREFTEQDAEFFSTSNIEISVFNKFALLQGGKPVKWPMKKAEELFAYLLFNQHHFCHKDKLADLLWPEYDYEKSIMLLQTTVYRLRKILQAFAGEFVLETNQASYRLNCQATVKNQLAEFYKLLETATGDDEAVQKIKLLAGRGLLADNDWEWKYSYESEIDEKFNQVCDDWLWVEE